MNKELVLGGLAAVLALGGPIGSQTVERKLALPCCRTGPTSARSMDELRSLAPGASDWLMLLGYHAPGDGGGGAFFWDASSAAVDNVGTVVVPDASPAAGRWRRVETSPLDARWFGAIGDGASHPLSAFFSSLSEAQTRYPHAVHFGDEIDWAAIQSAIDALPPSLANKGGGRVMVPAGNYRVSRPLELTTANTALHGEVNGATTLTYSDSGQFADAFVFVRSGLDTLTRTLFRVEVKNFFFDADTNPPAGMIGLDVRGISFSRFADVTVQFRSTDCTGVYGASPSGASPYYNLFTGVNVFGTPAFASSGCRGYWFTGDPTSANPRFAPNANTVIGGYLAGLEYGYVDSGTGNNAFGLVIESVRVGYELGVDAVGPYTGFEGATNNTTIVGPYLEDGGAGSTAYDLRETAAAVSIFGGYRTGYDTPIQNEGTSTTLLPGGSNSTAVPRGLLGGHIDMLGDSLTLKNNSPNLVLETEVTSFAFEPTIDLNQKHATDVRIRNQSAFAGSATLRVDNVTGGNEMLRVSGSGDVKAMGDIEVGETLLFTGGPRVLQGSGLPATPAPEGSLYLRTDGGAESALFVRQNGAWVAK